MKEFKFKFITVRETPNKGKTRRFLVFNNRSRDLLATIEWYGSWRQYVLYFHSGTVWNNGCLENVLEVLKYLKEEK